MKNGIRYLVVVLVLCMMLGVSALASAEPTVSAEPVSQEYAVTVSYNDVTYGYGVLELDVVGTARADGVIEIAGISWAGMDVSSYMTDGIKAELLLLLEEAGVVPEEPVEVVSEDYAVYINYNDVTYGYGALDLYVVGTAYSNGTIEIDGVSWSGMDVIGYMTESICAELTALLETAGVVPAAAPAEPKAEEFAVYVNYNDITYGYGPLDLHVVGTAYSDGAVEIIAVSWSGMDVIGYMTESIETELVELVIAAGVLPV